MGNYDQFAKKYAKLTEEMETKTRKQLYDLLPDSLESKMLLDVGCGSGQDAEYYYNQGAKVYGQDISQKEIQIAQERKCGKFSVSDMSCLPYHSNTFDIITSIYALQASDNVTKTLLEMIRVAKPGAAITIITKHPLRNLLEGYVNDGLSDYYAKRTVTSHIFNHSITLSEPGHTMAEYLHPKVLAQANLELFEEYTDFPSSDQVMRMIYPTYMILKFRKK